MVRIRGAAQASGPRADAVRGAIELQATFTVCCLQGMSPAELRLEDHQCRHLAHVDCFRITACPPE
jgi:hypothetical protein